jgi:hypothetical protein
VGVSLEDFSKATDSRREERVAKPKVDNAPVWFATNEDTIAKVPVVGDQDPVLSVGNSENVGIGQSRPMLRNQSCVMTLRNQVCGEARVGTFVNQKSHGGAKR